MIQFNANTASWDDVRLFLACARARSFRDAAQETGAASSTVTRRIERFEEALGAPLFQRLPGGIQLTAEGEKLYQSAQKLEQGAFALQRAVETFDTAESGAVRISIMDGLGIFWITPRILAFQRANPGVTIDLQCADRSADVLRCEADIAVQFIEPTDADLIRKRLGKMHIYPFAAKAYLEAHGVPKTPQDVLKHRIVDQAGPQIEENAIARRLGVPNIDAITSLRTNSSAANFYAIEKGAGIGGLPTYAKALGANVEPVDIGVSNSADIWMTYHPDAKRTARTALVIEWVKACFDPERFPWFRDELIHPDILAQMDIPGSDENIVAKTLIGRGI